MKFKAEVNALPYGRKSDPPPKVITTFSRRMILSNRFKGHKEEINNKFFMMTPITKGTKYFLIKEYDREDKKRFKIQTTDSYSAHLNINWWNRFKCNWIHRQYDIQKEWNWLWKTVIAALIVGIIGSLIGYEIGLKQAQEEYQRSHQMQLQQPTK